MVLDLILLSLNLHSIRGKSGLKTSDFSPLGKFLLAILEHRGVQSRYVVTSTNTVHPAQADIV